MGRRACGWVGVCGRRGALGASIVVCLSSKNECGLLLLRHVTPRPGGVVPVERRSSRRRTRADDRVRGGPWIEENTRRKKARNTFRGTSMERAIPRLCLALLGRDGPRNGRIGEVDPAVYAQSKSNRPALTHPACSSVSTLGQVTFVCMHLGGCEWSLWSSQHC